MSYRLNGELQPAVCLPQGGLDSLGRIAGSEDKAEIAVALGPTVFVHFGDHKPSIKSLPKGIQTKMTHVRVVSNDALNLGEAVRRLTSIDLWFLPGLICRLAGCRDRFLRLNYLVARRCQGSSESCADPLYERYLEIARWNFL